MPRRRATLSGRGCFCCGQRHEAKQWYGDDAYRYCATALRTVCRKYGVGVPVQAYAYLQQWDDVDATGCRISMLKCREDICALKSAVSLLASRPEWSSPHGRVMAAALCWPVYTAPATMVLAGFLSEVSPDTVMAHQLSTIGLRVQQLFRGCGIKDGHLSRGGGRNAYSNPSDRESGLFRYQCIAKDIVKVRAFAKAVGRISWNSVSIDDVDVLLLSGISDALMTGLHNTVSCAL